MVPEDDEPVTFGEIVTGGSDISDFNSGQFEVELFVESAMPFSSWKI